MAEDFPSPKYIDDITCHEKWSEATQVLLGPQGTIRIEFCVYRWTAEPPVHRDRVSPVARVVLVAGQAEFLNKQIADALANLQQQTALAQAAPPSNAKN